MKRILLSLVMLVCMSIGAFATDYTDVLTSGADCFNVSGTSYVNATYTSSVTGVTYSAQMAGGESSIQLRASSTNKNSGVVVTANEKGLKLKSITVTFNSVTATARILNVYESASAYNTPSDLFATGLSYVAQIKMNDTSTWTYESENNPEFFGVRSDNGAMYISEIKAVWADSGSVADKEDPNLSFSASEVSVNLGSKFTAPTLNNPNNLEVTYSSSNTDVATVDSTTGAVTIVGGGTTIIKASYAGNETFGLGEASYTLTVTDNSQAYQLLFGSGANTTGYDGPTWNGNNSYSGTLPSTDNKWQLVNFNNNNNSWDLIKCGSKNNASVASISNLEPLSEPINKIVVNVSAITSNKVNSIKLYVADNSDYTNATEYSVTPATGDLTFNITTPAENLFYKIEFDCAKGTSNGIVSVKSVTFFQDVNFSDTREDAGISFGETTSFTIAQGDAFTAPTLLNPNNLAVTYTSSDEAVATVDADGKVTLAGGVGTTTIKATSEATDKFKAGSASYTLTVVAVANSFAEAYKVGNNQGVYVNFPMVVTYVNGQNCYVQNEAGDEFGLVYGSTSYEVGDVIPEGWIGTYTLYNGLNEIKVGNNMPAATEKAEVTYAYASSITAETVSQIVILQSVEFAAATPDDTKTNFTGTFDGEDLTFRNTFGTASVEAGTYDVKAAVSIYNTTIQLLPIEYTEVANLVEAPEVVVNGGKDTVEDENGEVVLEFTVDNSKGEYIWYMVTPIVEKAPVTPKTAALEGYTKLEGTTLSVANNNKVSYYLGDADGKQLSEVAEQTVDITTGIAAIEAENGEKVVYDMMGRRVVRTEGLKGLYIINGKKVAL